MQKENNSITSLEMYYIIIGYIIGIGVWALPKSQVTLCKQDGWIPTLVGGVYPLFIALFSSYIIVKSPNENILKLSEKYFGKIIGYILNFVLLTFFLVIAIMIISGFNNVMRVYATEFLPSLKIIGLVTILAGFSAYKGLKVLAKINKIGFFIIVFDMLLTIQGFKKGTYLNLQPMFEISIAELIKGSVDTFYSYSGVEILLILSIYIKDKENIRKKSIYAVITAILIYIYVVVVSIYYFGPEIVQISLWPLINVSESTEVAVINNLRFLFGATWIVITLRILSNYYYISAEIMQHLFSKMSKKMIYIILYFVFLYFSMKFTNEVFRRQFIDLVSLPYITFNVLFILSIAITIFFKKGNKNEKK